jgi:hypothetical protein
VTRSTLKFAVLVLLTTPLWLGADKCLEVHERDEPDGGDGDGSGDGDSSGDGDAPADAGAPAACAPSDCAGQPIPEIGCEEGEPLVLCERRADGSCRVRVDCPGARCGGFVGAGCADGEFCDVEAPAGDGCDVADGQGVCAPIPEGCSREYAPVCGCDRHTYASRCVAHGAGMSVLHEDVCTHDECRSIGGRVVASTGANIPECESGEDSYPLAGIEPVLCCLPAEARRR